MWRKIARKISIFPNKCPSKVVAGRAKRLHIDGFNMSLTLYLKPHYLHGHFKTPKIVCCHGLELEITSHNLRFLAVTSKWQILQPLWWTMCQKIKEISNSVSVITNLFKKDILQIYQPPSIKRAHLCFLILSNFADSALLK